MSHMTIILAMSFWHAAELLCLWVHNNNSGHSCMEPVAAAAAESCHTKNLSKELCRKEWLDEAGIEASASARKFYLRLRDYYSLDFFSNSRFLASTAGGLHVSSASLILDR